jgi:alkylhydroperoxidase family enzyme
MQPIDYNVPRVAPIEQPYPPEIQAVFDKIMPPGVPPLSLFTTLARVPRVYEKFRAGSLLDRGPLSMRHREIVIDRTCARCGCAYEWGVHVAFFAKRVGFSEEQVQATIHGGEFQGEEALLIRLADELHDTSTISDALWDNLSKSFSVEQIFECIALVGFYHTVSYFANGLKLRPEAFAARV